MTTRDRILQARKVTVPLLLLAMVCFSTLTSGVTSEVRAQEASTSTPIPTNLSSKNVQHATPQGVGISSEPIPSQIIIKFSSKASEKEKKAFVEGHGGKVVKKIDSLHIMVIQAPSNGKDIKNAKSPLVESIESDFYISALDDVIPNDPRYPDQWALPAIGAPSAWGQMPADAPKVTVAVIDSGICADHRDLAGRILDGWDFLESDAVPQDDFGHGCSVSGVIAANMNDGIGIAGVAPNAMLMPLRVLNSSGVGSYSDVAAAIVYAADNGAQVINLSLGGGSPSSTLEDAVNYAISKGMIVVAAAGNNGTEGALYPAAYPDVIAVGSVDPDLQHSSFSNYGPQIDIWAPGRDILTTKSDGSYGLVSGTSFAAPYISGAEAISLYSGKTINLDGSVLDLNAQSVVPTITPTPVADITSTPNTNTLLIIDFDRIVNLPLNLHQPLYDFLSTLNLSNTNLTVSAYRSDGEWSEIVVVPTYVVDEHWEVRLQQNDILRMIADLYSGTWKIYQETQDTIPLLSKIVPQSFIDYSNSIENLADTDEYLFPWAAGDKWLRTNGYHPGSVTFPYDFDFAPSVGSDSSVLAAITGRLYIICGEPPSSTTDSEEVQLAIADNTTAYVTAVYLHIAASSIDHNQLGQLVRRGRVIGSLYSAPGVPFDTPCGRGTGMHLHFEVPSGAVKIDGNTADSINANSANNPPYTSSNTKLDSSGIVACQQPFFRGNCEKFVLTDPDLTNNFVGNDKIRSIFVPAHWGIRLWQNTMTGNSRGACLDFPVISLDTGVEDLGNFVWTDCGDGGAIGSKIVDANGNSTVSAIEVTMGPNNSCIASVEALCGGPAPTPIPTQPTATLPPPSDGIEIVSVSNHVVKPGEQFNPSITIRVTSGSLVASRGDHLHAVPEDASNVFGANLVQPVLSDVPTGGTYTFDVNNNSGFRMTAPTTPGQYQSVWQMRVGGVHIGPQAVINITVKSDPVVTPIPTPTIDCSTPPDGITLYEFPNYQGRCINFPTQYTNTDVQYLGNTYLGDNVVSSLRVKGNWGVTLFRDADWNGTWQEFSSDDNDLTDNQIGDNTVSSLRVWIPGNPCGNFQGVILYRGRDFTGISQSFNKDAQFLGNEIIGDNTANSIRICGNYRVTLYRDPDWTGISETFTGSDSNLTDNPINDPNPTASSLRIVDATDPCNSLPSGVTLYSENDFNGRSQTFSSDVQYLGNTPFGNDAAKSLRVCGHWTVTVFQDADWNGTWANFTGASRELALTTIGTSASSLRMVDSYDFCKTLGPGVTLYQGRDFTGFGQTFTSDVSFLGNTNIHDNTATSIRQCGYNSTLYRDPDWQGFSESFTGREESNLTDNQIGQTSSSLRVWTIPPTPWPTITPSPTPVPTKPDLVPYDGSGWQFPLIPSSLPGDHAVGTLYAGQITYLDWGIFNNSNVNVIAPFKVTLYLDGVQINQFSYTSLDADAFHGIDDWNIYVDTSGYHKLKISVDSNNEIIESNENNNVWEGDFYWNAIPVTLTIAKTGFGSGTVTSNPAGINCGSDCSHGFPYNTSVSLTAAPAAGSAFYGWSGACAGSHGCVIPMTIAQSVTANFSKLGDGNDDGKVDIFDYNIWISHYGQQTSNGPSHGDFNNDGIVDGSDYVVWSANITYTLSVSKDGFGSGTVMSDPAGINCGSICSYDFTNNTQVTLTATPATGSAFYGWSGACTGSHGCVIPMTIARSVTATFSRPGDANGDDEVDIFDYNIWVSHYGQQTSKGPSDGDFNNDGTVDGVDYVIWLNNFPTVTCPTITAWKGEYWNNTDLSGQRSLCRNDNDIKFYWGMGTPDPSIPGDQFSARWTRTINFTGGIYRFHIHHDDGARLYVDNTLKLDVRNTCCVWDTVDVPLSAGAHTIRLYYSETGGAAFAELWWEQIGFIISGNAGIAGATLQYVDGVTKTVIADGSGVYSIPVPIGWSGTVTPYKTGYTFTPVNRTYSNLQNSQTGQNYTAQVCVGCADIHVDIGGVNRGNYTLPPHGSQRVTYGLDSGPVQVASSNAVPLIAALRDAWLVNGQVTSFAQLMGLPQEALSDTYYFPAYNNVTLSGQLRIANVDTVATDVTVTIAGVDRGTYHLNPNESVRPTYALDAGPVVVKSSGGAKIIAALRDAWLVNGQVTSFVQLMGLPQAALSDTYYFPAYNNLTLSGQLRIGNVDTVATDVTVTIAGVDYGPYHLNPNESVRPTYALDAGPVIIKSSGGTRIIAALRDAWLVNGQVTSFAQLMGLPKAALSDTYYFPAYNNVTLSGQLRLANVDSVATDVTVTIAGVDYGPYHLNPGDSVRPTYPLDAGPVVVHSSGNVKIIAALRDAWLVNSQVTSFVQLMGLPKEALSTTYFFPAYNNLTLSGQLRFGVP